MAMSSSLAAIDPVEAARVAGFDISMMDSNLDLSAEERLLRHDSALALALELRRAGEIRRAQSSPTSPASR
jgi:hypothetical protein